MKTLLLLTTLILSGTLVNAQKHYICYICDDNSSLQISICFENNKATYVKYKGEDETISLYFVKTKYEEGGAYPTTTETYVEKYRGETNGTYILTHSGIWDYVNYTRKSDGKKFNFTIDHESSAAKNGGYRTTPCY
jgi:hypothetical protein